MLKIGVLVSGGGTNLQAIIDRISDGYLDSCSIATVVSSRRDAYALERARLNNIPAICFDRKDFFDIDAYDTELIGHMESCGVDLIVMAGFLSILGDKFINKYKNQIINVHPSLIPSFCGSGFYGLIPHEKALEYGVKVTGATVHFVTLQTDAGPIIMQKPIFINENDTPKSLQKRVMEEAEWIILPQAIKLFSEGRLAVIGRKVRIL